MALHTYTKTEYKNAPDHKTTPLNATNLNKSEDGIENAYTDIKSIYDETGDLIASRQETLTADRVYSIGDQFIYGGKLYKVTAAISSGGTITIGTNASLADSVTEQICKLYSAVFRGSVTVTANGVKTWSQLLDELYNAIDKSKVDRGGGFGLTNSDNTIFTPIYNNPVGSAYEGLYFVHIEATTYAISASLKPSGSTYATAQSGVVTDISSDLATRDFTFYYGPQNL